MYQAFPTFTLLTWRASTTGMKILHCLHIFPTIGSRPSQLFARSPVGTIMNTLIHLAQWHMEISCNTNYYGCNL